MSANQALETGTDQRQTISDIARDLGAIFATRAAEAADEDTVRRGEFRGC